MLKIRTMRWGHDDSDHLCGPENRNHVVEIVVTDYCRHNYFITENRMGDNERIIISPFPVFDLLMEARYDDVDWDYENDKIERIADRIFEFESDNAPEELEDSEFASVIKLVRYAALTCCTQPDPDQESAWEFISDFVDEDADDIDIPVPEYHDDYEDDYNGRYIEY